MEVRVSRASAVVVQRVPPAAVDWVLEWQKGVTATAESFAGYNGTDVYPPGPDQGDEWVAAIHFADENSLQGWLNSAERTQWIEKLRSRLGEFDLQTLLGGFGFWFVRQNRSGRNLPPGWKMVLAVLIGLYPIVMLLSFDIPYTAPLGRPLAVLLDCLVSVPLLQYIVMPMVTSLLGPWLRANGRQSLGLTLGGTGLILVYFVTMVCLFRLVFA